MSEIETTDNETREPLVRQIDRFLGFTKFQFVLLYSVTILLLLAIMGGTLFYRVNENAKTLTYICNVSTVFDKVIVDAGNQIQKNFDNGTYDRLLRQGVITQENVDAARKTLASYRETHRVLIQNGACKNHG
jgi:hypothetical protein